ncbi:MAG TPA: DNA-binding protein [Candidatus Wunengus sp. YC60]|uniref:DNA-binding protein n=1 Tax=Candidatus Wunengus sp. YC60 TaxID=3367697 RepID=UPI0040294592
MITASCGNTELLKLPKTAFLCSRNIPASVVLKCYDWAIAQREKGTCVISGFHSKIEKDVFHYLLSGTQPVIMALARGMKDKIEPEIKTAIDAGRLVLVTPFDKRIKRVTEETAETRNRLMIELADEIAIGYASKGGMLEKLINEIEGKRVYRIIE